MLRSRLDRFGGPSTMVTFDGLFLHSKTLRDRKGFYATWVLEYTKNGSLKSVVLDIENDWVLCLGE